MLTCGLAQLSALEPLLLLPLCLLLSCTLLLLEPLPLLPLPLCLLSCTQPTHLAALQLALQLAVLLVAALKRIVFRCQFKLQCTDHARSRSHVCLPASQIARIASSSYGHHDRAQ